MRKRRLLVGACCRLVARLSRYRDEALEAEASEALAQDDGLALASCVVVPYRLGFDGLVGPSLMCAPAL
jgi:hypothetical protein